MFDFITELYNRNKWTIALIVIVLTIIGLTSKSALLLYVFLSLAVLCCWAGYKKEFDFVKEIVLFPITAVKFIVNIFKSK